MTDRTANRLLFWFKVIAEAALFIGMQYYLYWYHMKH